MTKKAPVHTISVIVPKNPFVSPELQEKHHCLCALDVAKLMEWWPGKPHSPHRDPQKITAIQRALDWKRIVQIAAYLLQREVLDGSRLIEKYFTEIYEPQKNDKAREWPPKVPATVGFQRSAFPTFANVLIHVNGAAIKNLDETKGAADLVFDPDDKGLRFSVIDGQHRINGAFLAVCILQEEQPDVSWEIPAEIFVDLDKVGAPPRHQAQIFIDVNSYQKKVDRSLVADLFPTARGARDPLDFRERAQDLGRKLMLETGPLVGMIQIPGIKYGTKDVVTLATLNSALEDLIPCLDRVELTSLEEQAEFVAQSLSAWLEATGRQEKVAPGGLLDSENVVYQGRVLVSVVALLPACVAELRSTKRKMISERSHSFLVDWFRGVIKRAGLEARDGRFIEKSRFKEMGFLGSGGIAKFRDRLWAATQPIKAATLEKPAAVATAADNARANVAKRLANA